MCKSITVKNLVDRILVRMEVREAARDLNFNLIEQARISMAAYGVINRLDMGETCDGEVFVYHMNDGKREGIQVICTANSNKNTNVTSTLFNSMRSLVDELNIENITPNTARVSVIMWADKPLYIN